MDVLTTRTRDLRSIDELPIEEDLPPIQIQDREQRDPEVLLRPDVQITAVPTATHVRQTADQAIPDHRIVDPVIRDHRTVDQAIRDRLIADRVIHGLRPDLVTQDLPEDPEVDRSQEEAQDVADADRPV